MRIEEGWGMDGCFSGARQQRFEEKEGIRENLWRR